MQPQGIPRRLLSLCVQVLVSLIFLTTSALACALPDLQTDQRPDPDHLPTEVTVRIAISDFLGVDDANQQLDIDLFLHLNWTDERLSGAAGCRFPVSQVWFPRVRIMNSSNLRMAQRNQSNQVAVHEGGRIEYVQRLTGKISSYHNLRQFPFDAHQFRIDFGADRDGENQVAFLADNGNTWIADKLNIEGWFVNGVTLSVQPNYWREDSLDFSVVSLQIDAERNPEFYLYRVLLLLLVVVAMSWIIFWVPPKHFEFQIGLGATAMLTAIAFNLAISSHLPPVGYLTNLDLLVTWGVFMVVFAIIEAVLTARLVMKDREALALRLDRIARFVFPAMLLIGWIAIIVLR